jgi:adenine-specific DNA-methyltransferase
MNTLNQSLTSIKYKDGRVASKQLAALMGTNCFTNPKDVSILQRLMKAIDLQPSNIVLDFFSGSAATAEASMRLSLETKCRFIMVQIQENLDETIKYATGSAKTVLTNAISLCDELGVSHYLTEVGKERIRRAGGKIKAEAGLTAQGLDVGFRVLKLDDTNMNDVYYSAAEVVERGQIMLFEDESNIKPDRPDMDLLFGCLLDWGLPLSMPHTHEKIDDFTVHTYNGGDLIACFDEKISETAIREIAGRKPLRAVFRDSSFTSSPEKINVFEIFKLLAPNTKVKVI